MIIDLVQPSRDPSRQNNGGEYRNTEWIRVYPRKFKTRIHLVIVSGGFFTSYEDGCCPFCGQLGETHEADFYRPSKEMQRELRRLERLANKGYLLYVEPANANMDCAAFEEGA